MRKCSHHIERDATHPVRVHGSPPNPHVTNPYGRIFRIFGWYKPEGVKRPSGVPDHFPEAMGDLPIWNQSLDRRRHHGGLSAHAHTTCNHRGGAVESIVSAETMHGAQKSSQANLGWPPNTGKHGILRILIVFLEFRIFLFLFLIFRFLPSEFLGPVSAESVFFGRSFR